MIFKNRDGAEITLQKLKPLLIKNIDQSYKKRTPEPSVPFYETDVLGGEIIQIPHTESTVTTDDEKVEWAAYVEKQKVWDDGLNDLLLKAMITKGVVWTDDAIPADWIEEQEWLGVEVPEDLRERRILYFENELVSHPDDLLDMMQAIMRLSGLSEEALREAEDLFRGDASGREDN